MLSTEEVGESDFVSSRSLSSTSVALALATFVKIDVNPEVIRPIMEAESSVAEPVPVVVVGTTDVLCCTATLSVLVEFVALSVRLPELVDEVIVAATGEVEKRELECRRVDPRSPECDMVMVPWEADAERDDHVSVDKTAEDAPDLSVTMELVIDAKIEAWLCSGASEGSVDVRFGCADVLVTSPASREVEVEESTCTVNCSEERIFVVVVVCEWALVVEEVDELHVDAGAGLGTETLTSKPDSVEETVVGLALEASDGVGNVALFVPTSGSVLGSVNEVDDTKVRVNTLSEEDQGVDGSLALIDVA